MNLLLYHIAGGAAFFTGICLLLVAVGLSLCNQRRLRSVSTLLCIVGLIEIAVSATPLDEWLYVLCTGVTLVWLVAQQMKPLPFSRKVSLAASVCLAWLVAAAVEIPYRFLPRIATGSRPTITLVADSVSAGLSDREESTWPKLLEKEGHAKIVNHSQMGATVASAYRRMKHVDVPPSIVLLEIGGNDVLGSTTAAAFARDLDMLLAHLAESGRELLMFELPLPPFYNAFGLAQRRLARVHGVKLIPRWVFMSVLTADDATLDSIHLSKSGHRMMADMVRRVIAP